MQIHHAMLGTMSGTLQPCTPVQHGVVINANLAGLFGGTAQLTLTTDEALRLAQELVHYANAARAAAARPAGQ